MYPKEYHGSVTRPEFQYHFFGNGYIQGMVQINNMPRCLNGVCLYLMDPGKFYNLADINIGKHVHLRIKDRSRFPSNGQKKSASVLFSQRFGPEKSGVFVKWGENVFIPAGCQAADGSLKWNIEFPDGFPVCVVEYPVVYTDSGKRIDTPLHVQEQIYAAAKEPVIVRKIIIKNCTAGEIMTSLILRVFPNEAAFPSSPSVGHNYLLFSGQDEFLTVSCDCKGQTIPHESGGELSIPVRLDAKDEKTVTFYYVYASDKNFLNTAVKAIEQPAGHITERKPDAELSAIKVNIEKYDNLFLAARAGVQASICARTGKINAGVWHYNAEWIRDSSFITMGLVLTGQYGLARKALERFFLVLTDEGGRTVGESQWYEDRRYELDQNGELLFVLWHYLAFTGDENLIRTHWERIRAVAELPFQVPFWSDKAQMVHSERELWERDLDRHGMLDSFELGSNVLVAEGMECVSKIADWIGKNAEAKCWAHRAQAMKKSILNNPKFQLIQNGHFIKRRDISGAIQEYTVGENPKPLEPDCCEFLPMLYDICDPQSDLACATRQYVQKLWNHDDLWTTGGYTLYNSYSFPRGYYGPWILPTLWAARSALLAGDFNHMAECLDWILQTRGSGGYTWEEFQSSPGSEQRECGIIPWLSYAEILIFFMRDMLGLRVEKDRVTLKPIFLPGVTEIRSCFTIRSISFDVFLKKGVSAYVLLPENKKFTPSETKGIVIPMNFQQSCRLRPSR